MVQPWKYHPSLHSAFHWLTLIHKTNPNFKKAGKSNLTMSPGMRGNGFENQPTDCHRVTALWTLKPETQREDLSWECGFRRFQRQRKSILRVDGVLLENKQRQSSRPELLLWPTYKWDLEKGYLEGSPRNEGGMRTGWCFGSSSVDRFREQVEYTIKCGRSVQEYSKLSRCPLYQAVNYERANSVYSF